jgi:hypothetical protein
VDFIIVNDSGDKMIWSELRATYRDATFVFNAYNVGLIQSIDNGYAHILKSDYFFHAEDDWCVTKGGFIEKSFDIIHYAKNTAYKLVADNYQKGLNGFNDFAWHGFTTACGMKRLSDYKKVAPYAEIPWQGTIWHREQAIGERYHDLGYRSACLLEPHAVNIGYGRSEYVSGLER